MNDMNKTEIISELDRITSLWDKKTSLTKSIDKLTQENKAKSEDCVKKMCDKLMEYKNEQDSKFKAKRPTIPADCLVIPPKAPKDAYNIDSKDMLMAIFSGLGIFFSIILYVILAIIGLVVVSLIFAVTAVVATVFWFKSGVNTISSLLEWQEYKKAQSEWEEKFNKSATEEENKRFISECKKYDSAFNILVSFCSKKYNDEFSKVNVECEQIKAEYLKMRSSLTDELANVEEELDKVMLIHSDLFINAKRISSALKTGRADTLKEAINIALDDERKEKEAAARIEEAKKQRELLEQQAMEEKMHREAMENAAKKQAEAIKAQTAAIEKAAKEQEKREKEQLRDAQSAAQSRCMGCANAMKCTPSQKNALGACGGYRPRN